MPTATADRTEIHPDTGSLLTDDDLFLFNEGTHYRLYEKLGARPASRGGERGVYFAVWAPNANHVSVVGDFNGWQKGRHPLRVRGSSGIWEGFIPGVGAGERYKYHIGSHHQGYTVDKADPFGFFHEVPPKTASIVHDLRHAWGDAEWMARRAEANRHDRPISVYEVHLGSWMRSPDHPDRFLSYRDLAPRLADYCRRMGFTHVELLPVMEHPFYESWGYQTTGYFAPTSRYGTPDDFAAFVDHLHQNGVGVILDWVPSHFPSDEHGLAYFDGTHLFEHADPRLGFHPDWKSLIFNYGRHEVRSFLISSAMYWLDRFHADALRVDAVASMLYLDYSRREGEWIPNEHGGRENIQAIRFLQQFNAAVGREYPDAFTVAEESTAWPGVTRMTDIGGLGFGYKWDMGWMHDSLKYFSEDPIHRRYHHNQITFRAIYMFNENFMMPLSHDEVVHGKGSILDKMPGDEWQKFANNRLLFANQWANPGKKLLFMGAEFGQRREWNNNSSLDWHLAASERHRGLQRLVAELNRLYKQLPALHELDNDPRGFEWVDASDYDNSVIAFLRKGRNPEDAVLVVSNHTPVVRYSYLVGVPAPGRWEEILNTDATEFGGSGVGNLGAVESRPVGAQGRYHSLCLTLPPLATIFLKHATP